MPVEAKHFDITNNNEELIHLNPNEIQIVQMGEASVCVECTLNDEAVVQGLTTKESGQSVLTLHLEDNNPKVISFRDELIVEPEKSLILPTESEILEVTATRVLGRYKREIKK